jgi:transcriptional regulator with XRE-family HTH domain
VRLRPQRIQEARKGARLTQEGLAAAIGKHAFQVSHWETGLHTPRPETVAAIARETGRPLEFFFGDDDEEAVLKEELWAVVNRIARRPAGRAA